MAEEKTYNIPLRKEYLKVPKYKRAKKSVAAVKEFLIRHTKAEDIKIGPNLNKNIWQDGIKNPPHHVKVNVKVDDSTAYAELVGHAYEKVTVEKKKEPSTLKERIQAKIGAKDKTETKKEVLVEAKPKENVEKQKAEEKKAEAPKKEEKTEKEAEKPAEAKTEEKKPARAEEKKE